MINMDIQEGRKSEIYVITYLGEMEIKAQTNEKSNEKKREKTRIINRHSYANFIRRRNST